MSAADPAPMPPAIGVVRRALILAGMVLAAGPALAEDTAGKGWDEEVIGVMGEVVDGIGGVLKILVGPPISSPTPYIGLEGAAMPVIPPPDASPPSTAAPPAESPVVAETPLPPVRLIPPPAGPVPPSGPPLVVLSPLVVEPVSPPAPAPTPVPAQVSEPAPIPEPTCAIRVAATATLDQAARLPRCR